MFSGFYFVEEKRKKIKEKNKKNQRKKILKQRVSELFLNFANYE